MKTKILVIDDDPSVCQVIKEMLEFDDLDVLIANNAEDGLFIARYKFPKVILLDLFIPGMNGFDIYSKLKDDDRTENIPIIVITGHTDKKTLGLVDELGLKGIFYKPFNFGRLRKKLKSIIEEKKEQIPKCNKCGRIMDVAWQFCPYDGVNLKYKNE